MKKKRLPILIPIAVILLTIATAVTIAFMFRKTGIVDNTFVKAVVSCEVSEVFDSDTGIKSSIAVKNTGNISEYLRIRLISYWVDAEGNVVGKPSEMPTVEYDTDHWIKGAGDTYYCKSAIARGESTPEFLLSSVQLKYPPEATYYQVFEIIPEAIQAAPLTAVQELWGATVADDEIVAAN